MLKALPMIYILELNLAKFTWPFLTFYTHPADSPSIPGDPHPRPAIAVESFVEACL